MVKPGRRRDGSAVLMFTPEDEIDELHHELGRWRRRLHDAERAAGDWRQCSYVEVQKACTRYRFQIGRLERQLAERLAEQADADDAYELDGAA